MTEARTRTTRRLAAGVAGIAALAAAGAGALGVAAAAHADNATGTPLHVVRTGGVELHVPTSWHLAKGDPGCIVATKAAAPSRREQAYGPDRCQLRVHTGRDLDDMTSGEDLFFRGNPMACTPHGHYRTWKTTTLAARRYVNASYEYRRFTLPCTSRPAEQWYASGVPGVVVQRVWADPATENAARDAVRSAVLPPERAGLPRTLTGFAEPSGKRDIVLERARVEQDGDGGRVADPLRERHQLVDVSGVEDITYRDARGELHELTAAQYLRYVRAGFPHVGRDNVAISDVSSRDGAHVNGIHVEADAI